MRREFPVGVYDSLGYLTQLYLNPSAATSMGSLRAARENDLLGRVFRYTEWTASATLDSQRTSTYDADSLVLSEVSTSGGTTSTTTNYLLADGTVSSSSQVTASGTNPTTVNTFYGYEWWDSAKQSTITAQPYNVNAPGWKAGVSQLSYNANGHLASAIDHVAGKRSDYITNAQGLILERRQVASAMNAQHNYLYLDGRRVGDVGNDGDARPDYAQALAQTPVTDKKAAYRNWRPISTADFDQNYEPISPTYPGASPTSYTVKGGDTLQGIAASQWGDASLWYLIADANGLFGTTALTAGQVLSIPNKVTNVHNNSSTYRVYNPGEAIGDINPTLPDAPPPPPPPRAKKKKGCGGVGKVLMAVVAVVAVVVTAGAAAVAMGATTGVFSAGAAALTGSAVAGLSAGAAFGAAVIGGAVGSMLSQGVAMAMGMQDKFSWSQVAAGAIGAGVTAGIGGSAWAKGLGEGWQSAALRATASNVTSQGIQVATGLQQKFDWTAVAASAVGATVGYGVVKQLGGTNFFGQNPIALRTIGGMASGGAYSVVSGHSPNWSEIATQSFGDSLGQSVVESQWGRTGNALADAAVKQDAALAKDQVQALNAPGYGELGSGTFGLDADDVTGLRFVRPGEGNTGVVGAEGRQGAWGIAKSLAGEGASNAEINRVKNQLLTTNPELAGTVREGQSYVRPSADTPENIALARDADRVMANRAAESERRAQEYSASVDSREMARAQAAQGHVLAALGSDQVSAGSSSGWGPLRGALRGAAASDVNTAVFGRSVDAAGSGDVLHDFKTGLLNKIDDWGINASSNFSRAGAALAYGGVTMTIPGSYGEAALMVGGGYVAGKAVPLLLEASPVARGVAEFLTTDVRQLGTLGRGDVGAIANKIGNTAIDFTLDARTISNIQSIEKGSRPSPNSYMPATAIEAQLSEFANGASRLMSRTNFEKYGPAQRDGTAFVSPQGQIDQLLQSTKGNLRALEDALGLPDKFLNSGQLVRLDIPAPRQLGLRVPTGNEAGANPLWIPGGKLPNGNLEAIVDLGNAPTSKYSWKPLNL